MNDVVEVKTNLTRDQIRAAMFGKKHKGNTKLVSLFGVEIELRQPTLATILDSRDEGDEKKRITEVFIKYSYVPGTDELIFEDTDSEIILNWPFGEDLIEVQKTIAELTGVDLGEIEEELKENPLDGQS